MNIPHDRRSGPVENCDEAGLYTWDIEKNLLFADGALADLLGMDRVEAERGLPLQIYLDRVHPDDRVCVMKALRMSVATGQPYQENYRICPVNGSVVHIMVFGRAFRDSSGTPYIYSGIAFPMPVEPTPENKLLWHCLVAYDLAKCEGRTDVTQQLRKILLDLDWMGPAYD